ncbi:MAG: hypothetical protein NVS3B25_33220 [Hymenobacter sp.]
MLLTLDTPLLTPAVYPDLTETNPKLKNKGYIQQWGRAFVSQFRQSGSLDFYHGRVNGRYKLCEDYANGRQQVKAILKDEDGGRELDRGKVDLLRPLKLLKKSLRAVDGKLKDHDFVATVTPIDATAQDEKHAYETRLRVQMAHGAFLHSLGLGGPTDGPQGADLPVDEDELALHMAVKYRHRDAMLLEMKLALALYKADYDQVNRQCLRDETVYGSSVMYLALRGTTRLPVRLNPGHCMFLPADTETYANLQAGAHVEKITLAQLYREIEADPDTTLDDGERNRLETLARQSMLRSGGNYASAADTSLTGPPELAAQLEVVRFSFKSFDAVVLKEYTNKFGNPQVREKPAAYQGGPNSAPGKVHRQTVASWYEGTLVVGTELGYGCRKAYEQLRDEDNPFDCHPLYVVTSPDLLGGRTESIVEQCMDLVDEACSAWARVRFKLATMKGSWTEFDLDALESGLSDKETARDAIANFFKNGFIVGRKQALADQGQAPRPLVTAGELNFMPEIQVQFDTIDRCVARIQDITGINGSISSDDPASRQGAGVTQLAIQGAENTLDYLYHAKQSRFERVVRALAVSLKQSEARAPLTGPVPPGFDAGGETLVGTSATLPGRVMQCTIERVPTTAEWQDFYETAKVALTEKTITLADYSFLRQIKNLKQASALLGVRAKRNQMEAAQLAQQNTTLTSQQQQQSAQVTGDETRKTLDVEFAHKMALEELKGRNMAAVAEIQKNGHLDAQELIGLLKMQQQSAAQAHQAELAAQAHDVSLAQQSAQLDSQEQEGAAQRSHEAEQNAQALAAQPEPAAA